MQADIDYPQQCLKIDSKLIHICIKLLKNITLFCCIKIKAVNIIKPDLNWK